GDDDKELAFDLGTMIGSHRFANPLPPMAGSARSGELTADTPDETNPVGGGTNRDHTETTTGTPTGMNFRGGAHTAGDFVFDFAAPRRRMPGYIESSNGLEEPKLEKGNTEIEFGDVNGDGQVDIVSIGDHGSPYINSAEHGIMVWFGDGGGNWSLSQNGNFG